MRHLLELAVRSALAILSLAVVLPRSAAAAVALRLSPEVQYVDPGGEFEVTFVVADSSTTFDGFHVVLEFDPAHLTPVPLAPISLQEGCLISGACSSACGQTFHRFSTGADSVSATDVLLCGAIAVRGPGTLYRLRFRASSQPGFRDIRVRRARLVSAGVDVGPLQTSGCEVHVGVTTAVGGGPGATPGALRVEPNPARGALRFVCEGGEPGWVRADVIDSQGRMVRRLGPTWMAGRSTLSWDGAAADGQRARPGVYWVRMSQAGRVQERRFVLLE